MDAATPPPRADPRRPVTAGQIDALARDIGLATAAEGLDLECAIERLHLVRDALPRRDRRRFDLATLAVALTEGWVWGVMERGVDISLELLRSDAHERYRRCLKLGIDPAYQLAIAMFRVQVGARTDTASAAVAVLRALAASEFAGGESVAVCHDKVLVLVHRTDDLALRVRALARRMNDAVAHLGTAATCWIEPLSSDEIWLDDHLDALLV